jgi:hypothetical protein
MELWTEGIAMQGFPEVFYPSTRQRCSFGSTYKSSTRQVTRQQASAPVRFFRRVRRGRMQTPLNRNRIVNKSCQLISCNPHPDS